MRIVKFSFLFLLIVFFAFQKEVVAQYVILSGKIDNPNSDTLALRDADRNVIKVIHLNNNNTFRDTFEISKGYYSLFDGKEETTLFLKPGYDLKLYLNTKEFDESIVYEGKGSLENNYMAKKFLLRESMMLKNYYGYYAKLPEKEFLNLADSVYNVQMDFLKQYPGLDSDLVFLESNYIKYEKLMKIADYQAFRRFLTGDKDFKVSENFPDPYKDVDLSNADLLQVSNYLHYAESYLKDQAYKLKKENYPLSDFYLVYVRLINDKVKNEKIKEELFYKVGRWELNYTSQLDSVYNFIIPYLKKEKHKKEVEDIYKKLKKTANGEMAPDFKLVSITGDTVSLSQLKGNLVYIDIWSTWCLPCIKEIPNLKKLQKQFEGKEIKFVSICKNDSKERWEKMVKEKELGGIQLFAPDENIPFFTDFIVQGVPRFIFIDKDGRIIERYAKRPSNPKLAEEIEKYLKQQ